VPEYAAALMRVTLRGFHGFTSGTDFGRSGTESGRFGRVPTMEVSRQSMTSWIHAVTVAGKRCCPIPSQSRIVVGEPAVS